MSKKFPKIKFCGLKSERDIGYANEIMPDYVGFVFAKKSRRFVDRNTAIRLRAALADDITAVGVFVNEKENVIASYLNQGVIDIAQLHGDEDDAYIENLRSLTDKKIIKAFRISSGEDVKKAVISRADHILLDAGSGDGMVFDWSLLKSVRRPYFLAGGLSVENVAGAVEMLHPFAVDVSSGIETDGVKDINKMRAFAYQIREKLQ